MAEAKLTVHLTALQLKSLKEHADKKKRSPEDDLVAVWWGRTCALETYAEKKNGEKKPRKLKASPKKEIIPKKLKLVKPARTLTYRIDMYDIESVALSKARLIAEGEAKAGNYTEKDVIEVLKKAGRDKNGKLVKK